MKRPAANVANLEQQRRRNHVLDIRRPVVNNTHGVIAVVCAKVLARECFRAAWRRQVPAANGFDQEPPTGGVFGIGLGGPRIASFRMYSPLPQSDVPAFNVSFAA